jgi:pimeloyl-ACP methyl ester carboxylesterase
VPASGDYRIDTLASDAAASIEALGEKSAIVVGHHWGASAAFGAAIQFPERVRLLVTLARDPTSRVAAPVAALALEGTALRDPAHAGSGETCPRERLRLHRRACTALVAGLGHAELLRRLP